MSIARRLLGSIGIGQAVVDDLVGEVRDGGDGAVWRRAALEWAKKFSLEGIAQKIECPVLILHGENDRVVPLAEAKTLYEKVGAKNKTLKIFTAEEGGTEHCQVDNRQLGIDYVGDWLLANT